MANSIMLPWGKNFVAEEIFAEFIFAILTPFRKIKFRKIHHDMVNRKNKFRKINN